MESTATPVQYVQRWAAARQRIKCIDYVIKTYPHKPTQDSDFSKLDLLIPIPQASMWCLALVTGGCDHLMALTDGLEHRIFKVNLRPPYTLARGAIECSSKAVWAFGSNDLNACAVNFFILARNDVYQCRQSLNGTDPKRAENLKQIEDLIEIQVRRELPNTKAIKPPGYGQMVKDACKAPGLNLDSDEVGRLWSIASGAAHGQYWVEHDVRIPDSARLPDLEPMTKLIESSSAMTFKAAVIYLRRMGCDREEAERLMAEASEKFAGGRTPSI